MGCGASTDGGAKADDAPVKKAAPAPATAEKDEARAEPAAPAPAPEEPPTPAPEAEPAADAPAEAEPDPPAAEAEAEAPVPEPETVSRDAFIAAAAARVDLEHAFADFKEAAINLDGISKGQLMELKSMQALPKPLLDILTCVSILKGDRPQPGPHIWKSIKQSMSNTAYFLDQLQCIAPECLDEADIKRVQDILATPDMTPQAVSKFSTAAPIMLTWVIALVGVWIKFKVYTTTQGETGGETEAEASAQATPTPNPDDMAQAQAALSEALAGLNKVRKMDIMEVKAMKTPPKMMQDVFTCIATLKVVPQPDKWGSILKMLSDTGFIRSLHTIGWQDVSEREAKRVDAILASPDMTPEAVRQIGGPAGDIFFAWVVALMNLRALMTRPAQAEGEAQHTPAHGTPAGVLPNLADGSELVWVHLGGAELEPQLLVDAEMGAAPIRLVDARYLIALAQDGGRLGRRQDLPDSALSRWRRCAGSGLAAATPFVLSSSVTRGSLRGIPTPTATTYASLPSRCA